jgi:hypothetical protein
MLAKFGEAVGEFDGKIADTIAARAQRAQAENERAGATAKAMAALRQTIEQFDAEANPDAVTDRMRVIF